MEKLRLLVVGGHPADLFDNCGGTLLHHTRRGDTVTGLVITHGAQVHDQVLSNIKEKDDMLPAEDFDRVSAERAEVRRQEVIEACALCGFDDIRYLWYDDIVLTLKDEIIRKVASVVREVRPHIVITHFPFDNGGISDHHAVTGQTVLYALGAAHHIDPDDPNPPAASAQVFFFGMPSVMHKHTALYSQFSAFASVLVDITDCAEVKHEMLNKLKSQSYDGDYARKRMEALDGSLGWTGQIAYAEAFIPHKADIYTHLPVSETLLKRAVEPEHEKFERISYLFKKM